MKEPRVLEPCEPRDDFRPVLIGGDLGSYAIGREFYEAFGVRPWCVAEHPIAAIAHSSIFDVFPSQGKDAEGVFNALLKISERCGHMPLVVATNGDLNIARLAQIKDRLPGNIHVAVAPAGAIEAINDKETFAGLCAAHGIRTPRTQVARLGGTEPIEPWSEAFPIVVKPARSGEYMQARLAGFSKVYLIEDQAALSKLLGELRAFGFAGDMLLQQVIMGDDTYKRSLTLYLDRSSRPVLNTGAQVLLEDHRPDMIGNPVTMVTRDLSDFGALALELLEGVGWTGAANFDLKVDARTGETYALECNPRMGRNCYYVAASAANPARLIVNDLLDGADLPLHTHARTILYSVVPLKLALRYLEGELAEEARELAKNGLLFDPVRAPYERKLKRRVLEGCASLNYWRKYAKYYPKANSTGI